MEEAIEEVEEDERLVAEGTARGVAVDGEWTAEGCRARACRQSSTQRTLTTLHNTSNF